MRRTMSVVVMIMIAIFSLAGCAENQESAMKGKFTPETLPRIDGATAQAPYYEAMAAELLGMPLEEARQYVQCNKTDGAYENLIRGDAEVIFANIPSEGQKESAAQVGVAFELIPYVNGGFVFFVNKDNPVDSLTKEQLHDIYGGKIDNWKEVGGEDLPIIAYQRAEDSGSQTGLYAHIIAKEEVMKPPTEKVIAAMEEIVDAVSSYENAAGAIGYSYYYYVANMYGGDQVKLIAVEGIMPSDETISTEEYPLTTPSYVILRANEPEGSPARQIAAFALSEDGQRLAKENGYVPRKTE